MSPASLRCFSVLYRAPVSCTLAMLSLVAFLVPGLGELWQLDRGAVGRGQLWRLLSGHLTHHSASHLIWDWTMFLALAAICEATHRRSFAASMLAMSLVVSVGLPLLRPDVAIYRGLSGIDTGLFVWFLIDQSLTAYRRSGWGGAGIWAGLAIALGCKLTFEALTGQTLFVDAAGFTPLVESHLLGGAAGLLIGSLSAVRATRLAVANEAQCSNTTGACDRISSLAACGGRTSSN